MNRLALVLAAGCAAVLAGYVAELRRYDTVMAARRGGA